MKTFSQHRFGDSGALELREVPRPERSPSEVLVKVEALSVNPVDVAVREGVFPLLGEPPFTLGWDVSGTIDSGDGFAAGQPVFSLVRFPDAGNANAEFVAVPADQVATRPESLTTEQAAALPMVGLTAWQGLVEGAGVGVGDRVLVLGAGGGVGHIAVQIARAKGADVVGSASASKAEFVLSLGAEQVVDYADPDYLESAGQFDIVFDTIGGETAGHALDRLVPGGRFVTIREQNNDEFAEQVRARGNRFVGTFVRADGGQLAELAALADSGALRVEVSAIYPFEQLAQAQDAVAAGRTRGKVVVTV